MSMCGMYVFIYRITTLYYPTPEKIMLYNKYTFKVGVFVCRVRFMEQMIM